MESLRVDVHPALTPPPHHSNQPEGHGTGLHRTCSLQFAVMCIMYKHFVFTSALQITSILQGSGGLSILNIETGIWKSYKAKNNVERHPSGNGGY
jgi:hypothetical protein